MTDRVIAVKELENLKVAIDNMITNKSIALAMEPLQARYMNTRYMKRIE